MDLKDIMLNEMGQRIGTVGLNLYVVVKLRGRK
jgi:hypothetical protein